jgi:hypothetical protein
MAAAPALVHDKLSRGPGRIGVVAFVGVLLVGLAYIGLQLSSDLSIVHSPSVYPFILLATALLVALGFEFVNGFHDTANAVATVIYTHSLDPNYGEFCICFPCKIIQSRLDPCRTICCACADTRANRCHRRRRVFSSTDIFPLAGYVPKESSQSADQLSSGRVGRGYPSDPERECGFWRHRWSDE